MSSNDRRGHSPLYLRRRFRIGRLLYDAHLAMMALPRRETKYIVVTSTMTDERLPMAQIEWRARKYGFLDVGCHFVIEPNDLVTTCRPHHVFGVGVRPHNSSSVIITLSGKPEYTWDQLANLGNVVETMIKAYPGAQVAAHSALPNARSEAPGFDVDAWWRGYQAAKAIGA